VSTYSPRCARGSANIYYNAAVLRSSRNAITLLRAFSPSSAPHLVLFPPRRLLRLFAKMYRCARARAHTPTLEPSPVPFARTRRPARTSSSGGVYIVTVNVAREGINIAFGTIWRHGGLLKCKLHYHSPGVITFFSPSPAFSRARARESRRLSARWLAPRALRFTAVALARDLISMEKEERNEEARIATSAGARAIRAPRLLREFRSPVFFARIFRA